MEPLSILIAVMLFLTGACIGSFLNVVIWRLPHKMMGAVVTYQGKTGPLTLSWPPSHCPNCDASIPWFLNLPIVGWLIIAGRCVNCRKPIALRYPIVELATAILFLGTYLAYAVGNMRGPFDISQDWPALGLHLIFVAALLAAAAIDADSYIIPLSIPVVITIVAVIVAPLTGSKLIPALLAPSFWHLSNPIIGAAAGLILANILLLTGVIPLSFPDPKEDESQTKADAKQKEKAYPATETCEERIEPLPLASRKLAIVLTTLLGCFAIFAAWLLIPAAWAALVSICAGAAIFLVGVLSRDQNAPDATEEVMEEISASGARQEILKEVLFLMFPLCGALIGACIPAQLPHLPWLDRLLTAVAGLLVGGGSIWVIRILGTLWKGIQAMGLGDVYLMAAAGAVLGPTGVLVAFPLISPILALGWALIRYLTKKHTILPFGPWLAMASIFALFFGEPILRWYAKFALGS